MTGWGDSECEAGSLQYLGLFQVQWNYTTCWPISRSCVQLVAGGWAHCGDRAARVLPSKPDRGSPLLSNPKRLEPPSPRAWLNSVEKLTRLPHTLWAFSSHPEPSTLLVMSTCGCPSSPSVFSCASSPKPAFRGILRVNKGSSWVQRCWHNKREL